MMEQSVAFSVIIPVYNAGPYLSRCIDSVLNQSLNACEIILVDDGSTDGSGRLCDEYADRYATVCVIHKENKGPLHTRELGVKNAVGDWVLVVDADDYLDSEALRVINGRIEKYNPDIVVFGFRRFSEEGVLSSSETGADDWCSDDQRTIFKTILSENRYNVMWRKAIRRTCFKGKDYTPFYYLRRAEDLLQSVEALENAQKLLIIDDVLYNYRNTPGSIMNTVNYTRFLDELDVYGHIYGMLEKASVYSDADFAEYKSYVWKHLVQKILAISCDRQLTGSERKKIFGKIKAHRFYEAVLRCGTVERRIMGKAFWGYWFFIRNCYFGIDMMGKLLALKRKLG